MVDVQLLGGFQVVLPGGSIAGPWARPSARRVFQVLVLREQRRIGREELTEMLFPDLAPEGAAKALSKALSMARAALAPIDIISADRDVVWLTGEMKVDAEEQRGALRQAMALPPGSARDAGLAAGLEERGRLLDDDLYADWASEAREELEGLRASARLTLARDRSAGHGRASSWDAVEAWREVLAQDRSNEEACSALIRAYGASRMRDLAVRTYHRTVVAIHELGLEPSGPLRSTYSQALEDADDGPPPSESEAPRSRVRTFGRDAALAELRDLVANQQRGSCGAVLVSGPAGIGKTHLLDALGRELATALVAALVPLVGCGNDGNGGDSGSGAATAQSAAPTTAAAPATSAVPAGTPRTVEVGAIEYAFQLPAANIPAGPVVMTLANKGAEVHQLTLVRLADGMRADDVVAGLRKGDGSVLAGTTSVGGPNVVLSGGRGTVSVDLAPSTYVMVCYVASPRDQQAHSQRGMVASFKVEGPAPAPSTVAPATKGTITITDGGYQVPAGLTSGSYRVVNEFAQPADAALLKLRPGATAKDVEAFFAGGALGPTPFTLAGGMATLSPRPAPRSTSPSRPVPTCSWRSRSSRRAVPPSSCPAC